MKKKRVLVGMSGWVDSAVTAHLLQQEGYEVVAGFMKNYATEQPGCTTKEDRDSAIKAAQFLGIQSFMIFDFRKEYEQAIINYIFEGYQKGITPNPDILCNSEIKFKLFLEKALEFGFDMIATGHYVSKEYRDDEWKLIRGVDPVKDQSYFLCDLNQYQLEHALFPLGKLHKSEVRQIASSIGLPNAERKDSQGLCFIGNVPMAQFLKQKLPEISWDLVDKQGKKIWRHKGAWFYTIGQRRGIGHHEQVYVIKTDVKSNIVMVGGPDDLELFQDSLECSMIHRIGKSYDIPLKCQAKIRYRQSLQEVELISMGEHHFKVLFQEPQKGIAAGQIICLYHHDDVVGSATIL